MATLTRDTERAVGRLTASAMPEGQARAVVETLHEVNLADIATKEDIALLKADIERMKAGLLRWLIPILLGQAALFTAIVGWLLSLLR